MLPSFRLIVTTFLCGFAAVYAGLRLAVSLNDIHQALPVMTAHAAPIPITPTEHEFRRGAVSSVPAMFDMRFAIGATPTVLVRTAPSVLERPLPPLSAIPPQDVAAEAAVPVAIEADTAKPPIEPEGALAAIQPEPPVLDSLAAPWPKAPSLDDPQQ